MTRSIDVRIGDVTATAELLEAEAPETCRFLWDHLPYEGTMRNLRYGGNATFIEDARLLDKRVPIENRLTWHVRGTLAFRPEFGEVIVPYGAAQARGPRSVADWATAFARLTTNAEALLAEAERVLHTGARPFAMRRRA